MAGMASTNTVATMVSRRLTTLLLPNFLLSIPAGFSSALRGPRASEIYREIRIVQGHNSPNHPIGVAGVELGP